MSQINFKIRCSAIGKIMSGRIGLTEIQEQKMRDLITRRNEGIKPLTANMESELKDLQLKHLNPELPEGAKTYCKQWIKEYLYGRREQIKSKYISKGNETEQDGFTLMAVELKLGMVYSNTELKDNGWLIGTCDLDHEPKDTVYDNKSSWTLDQFPMFESECPNKDYEAQIQGYMELWGRGNGSVVYTLNDMPRELLGQLIAKPWLSDNERQQEALNYIYTREYWDAVKSDLFPSADEIKFIEIPSAQRVKEFKFARDEKFIADLKVRHGLCQKYINTLLK